MVAGSVERRQLLAVRFRHDTKLVIGNDLEQRFGQQAQALDLLRRRATVVGLVACPHDVDGLLNQRLAGLDHPDESALLHRPAPVTLSTNYKTNRGLPQ